MLIGARYQLSLILDAKYGMTNRLRAYGSARAIADASARFLVILWDLDGHCQAPFTDLFQLPPGVHVLTNGKPLRDLLRGTYMTGHFDEYDLMDPAQKHAEVDGRSPKHIYVRSAFIINSKYSYGNAAIIRMR